MLEETVEIKMNKEEFNVKLQLYVTEYSMDYIDAVVKLCEESGLEYDEVPKLIDEKTKIFIENEYREMNYLPRLATLPL
jgi:hypothetical protein